MPLRTKFQNLKKAKLQDCDVSLAVIKEYKKDRISQYIIKYVGLSGKLTGRLRNILIKKIEASNTFEPYSFDCPEPEEDEIRAMNYESTDFYRILEQLQELSPEEDKIESLAELLKSKAYLIILSNQDGIQTIGFKTLPESWKMKREKGLIPLMYKDNSFEDLENENIFSISNTIDFIYYDDSLFIISKKAFEAGLNFRDGMLEKAEELYSNIIENNLFVNIDILQNKVGNNQRYLRKIATIKNLGYYQDVNYLKRLQEISLIRNWGIQFVDEQIVITEESLESILTALQNKRLHSELTDETFDVDSAKRFEHL